MKLKFILLFLLGILVIEAENRGYAQTGQPSSNQMKWSKSDSSAINALVMYPDSIRLDIFEACKYPAVIVRISTEQKNTSATFDSLLSSYSKDEQQNIWDLTRYPGLIQRIVAGGPKSSDQINNILADYPAEIHDTALKYGVDYFTVLQSIDNLQAQTDQDFQSMLAENPPVTQHAFQQLIQLPEVLSLLNDHLELTVLVGDRYRRDPQRVIRKADSLNLVLARENAQEVQDWKDSLQQNPEAQSDLKAAANDYAQENGYSADEVSAPVNGDYVDDYTVYPYSYWFGYPTWYPYSYWYPYPYWYDCGFYFNPMGQFIFFGLPSYNFTNWYFYHPEHWHRYPHLGSVYVNHYYGVNRYRYVSGNSVIVHKWVHDNRPYLPADFTKSRANRVEAIRQVGELNMEARSNPSERVPTVDERNQYLQSHQDKFTALNRTPQQPKMPEQTKQPMRLPENIAPPVRQQPVRIPATSRQQNYTTPQSQSRPSPSNNTNQINRAQDYHRSSWDQNQSSRPYSPPPMRSAPAPAPMRSSPPSGGGGRR